MKKDKMTQGAARRQSLLKSFASVVVAVFATSLLAAEPELVTGGAAPWFRDEDGTWRSGAVSVDQISWIKQTVEGPGTWSCEWKVSSDYGCGYVELYVDGWCVDWKTGNGVTESSPWMPVTYSVGEGEHEIVVGYDKYYESPSVYADCAWMRNWKWTPSSAEVTLTAGRYVKTYLQDLGYDVPTNGGTTYSVVAKGLPAGLALKFNGAKKDRKGKVIKKAKVEWWIEGVPTAAHDYTTNPAYLVITANGKTETLPLSVSVLPQEVTELDDLALGQSLNEQFYLPGVTNGWTVTGLPAGLNYTAKLVTTKRKSGKKTVVVTNALPYSVHGKTTKAGLFTVTAKKNVNGYDETMKYRVLVTPRAVDGAIFSDSLTNITTMAYAPFEDWHLTNDVAAVGGKVVKVTGLPAGLAFAASNVYAYRNAKKKTGRYLKQAGQTIVGTPTRAGTYVVTFTKNVKNGKKTVAKTAQILWKVLPNDAELSLDFNKMGGVLESLTLGVAVGGTVSVTEGAKVAVSGLPGGITLKDLGGGKWGFSGFATKAGTYLVTITATLNGKTVRQRKAFKVDGLPKGAKGAFYGFVTGADGCTNGLAKVSVSSVGKISGNFQEFGTNWTFSASCYDTYSPELPGYHNVVTAKYAYVVKVGKSSVKRYVTRKFDLYVSWDELSGYAVLYESDGSMVSTWQDLWGTDYKKIGQKVFYTSKKVPYKTFSFKGTTEAGAAIGLSPETSLSLKVKPNGTVTATLSFDTGKTKRDPKTKKMVKVVYKATCSSLVIPDTPPTAEAFRGGVYLYFAPSAANGFPGFTALVML